MLLLILSGIAASACGVSAVHSDPPALAPAQTTPVGGVSATAAMPDPAAARDFDAALQTLRQGDEAQASEMLRVLTVRYPKFAGPWTNLALIRMRHDELSPAAELLQQAIAVCARCAPVHNLLGVVERRQGQFENAERSYQKSIAADDTYAAAHFNLAVLYELYLRRSDKAAEEYGRYVELTPDPSATTDVNKWIADLKRRGTSAAQKTEVTQ
jgi:Tfp pilus assembly protein PilF